MHLPSVPFYRFFGWPEQIGVQSCHLLIPALIPGKGAAIRGVYLPCAGWVGGGEGLVRQGVFAQLQLGGVVHARVVGVAGVGGEEQQVGPSLFHGQIAALGPQGVIQGVALLGDDQLLRGLALQYLGYSAGGPGIAGGDVAVAVAGKDVFLSLRGEHHDQVADLLQLGHRCRLGQTVSGYLVHSFPLSAGSQQKQGQQQTGKNKPSCTFHGKPPL